MKNFNGPALIHHVQLKLRSILIPAAIALLWELTADIGLIPATWAPPPSKVAVTWYYWIFGGTSELATRLYSGTWVYHVVASTSRVVTGFIIAGIVGISLGLIMGWFKLAESLAEPLINILRPIPMTAWIPFAVIIFGIHYEAAVFLIALGAFFPMVINAYEGAKRTPLILKRAALMLGAKTGSLFYRVVLPSALPDIFTGLRLGMGVAWVLVIVAEMLAVQSGLGFVLWDAYWTIRMDVIIADMLTVGLLGFLSDRILIAISKYFLRWTKGITVG